MNLTSKKTDRGKESSRVKQIAWIKEQTAWPDRQRRLRLREGDKQLTNSTLYYPLATAIAPVLCLLCQGVITITPS